MSRNRLRVSELWHYGRRDGRVSACILQQQQQQPAPEARRLWRNACCWHQQPRPHTTSRRSTPYPSLHPHSLVHPPARANWWAAAAERRALAGLAGRGGV